MTHVPGHTGDAALSNLDSTLSGETGSATAYTGQVYFGKKEVPAAKGIIRGKKIDTGKQYGDETLSIAQAKAKYLTDAQLREKWNTTLRKNGFSTDPLQARALWEISIAGASDWYATSNGQQKITPEQYLTWYAGGKKKAPKPDIARAVYNYAPEQIAEDVDKIAQKVLGRTINDADKAASWYSDLTNAISNLAQKGTTTEVKDIRNPKTGKLERVTKQSPEFTTQAAAAKIESTLKNIAPEDAERKKRSDFMSWMLGQIGGGQ